MAHDHDTPSNRSANLHIDEVSDPARRQVLHAGLGGAAAAWLLPLAGCASSAGSGGASAYATVPAFGFKAVPPSTADRVVLPEGYVAQVLAPWGEPVGIAGQMPAWKWDASNSADEQAVQMGMHHDALHYFPLAGSRRGLLAINHEYTDDGLLHPGGQ